MKRLWANLFRRRRAEDALDAELRAYVAELTDRKVAAGMTAGEARRQALIEAGGIEQVKEEVRDAWLGQGILIAGQDVRLACRSLRRTPAFAAIVVATLTLGMGATVTMYSLMRGVLWRPLPYPEPERIVAIQVDARNVLNTGAALGEVLDLKERGRSFDRVSMIDTGEATVEYGGETERVAEARVSDELLPLLGARPALGRALEARSDDRDGPAPAILISDELWRRRFGATPAIVGKTVRVNDADARVAGVLAPGFRLFLPPSVSVAERVDVWFSFATSPTRRYRNLPVVARLRPGATIRAANAELRTLAAQFEREHPEFYSGAKGWQASPSDRSTGGGVRFTAKPLHEEITRDARPALILLTAAVAFVLLIACANVANLMLARGMARQRELAIRRALGASHFRIARQLFVESLVLAGGAAGLGLACARFGLEAIGSTSATRIPLQSRIGLDIHAALVAVAIAVGTSLAFGLLPAWRLAWDPADQPLRASRGETAARGARRLQRVLVALEIALSMMPLVCGGLMLRSFVNLQEAPLGFDPVNVVTAQAPFSLDRYPRAEQQWAWLNGLMDRVRAIPGVQAVSAGSPLPLAPNQERRRVGRADRPDDPPILATQQGAMPGYLGVMGTPLRAGRDFTDDDVAARRSVAMIDERLARRLWPGEDAIGKRLSVYRTGWRNDLEVVGVTAAVRTTRVRDETVPGFLMPSIETTLVIKTGGEPAERVEPQLQLAMEGAHAGRSAFDVRPMSAYVADSIGDTRFVLIVLAAFAGLSVLLTAVGLYGTLAYLTAQRTREFGVRLALGASVKGIVGIVVGESVWLAAAGVGLGLAGAVAAARAMRELLYGVGPLDGATLLGVVSVVAVVAVAAAGVPAWRAARTDPQRALRSE